MGLTLFILTSGLAWLLYYLVPLLRHYNVARKTGFPTLICPTVPHNPVWMVFSASLLDPMSKYLPTAIWSRIRYTVHGWECKNRGEAVPMPGPAFMVVTPSGNQLWIEEPELAGLVLAGKREYLQAKMTQQMISVMGENVMTREKQDWQRNRKIVAQSLNEGIMNFVWNVSRQQAKDMVEYFVENDSTNQTVHGLRQIAINVLIASGYGQSTHWALEEASTSPQSPDHKLSYVKVLDLLTKFSTVVSVVPKKLLCLGFMPKLARDIGTAMDEFPVYTKEALAQERELGQKSSEPRKSLLSSLVAISDREKQDGPVSGSAAQYLSEDEIQGNLYLFTVAGFDTTANTLAYAVTLMALHPEWLDWMIEEIDHVSKQSTGSKYEDVFPKLTRCRAVMYETLRLYTPVLNIGRRTDAPQAVTTSLGSYHIPADTVIQVAFGAIHVKEHLWGDQALEFLPSRWLTTGGLGSEQSRFTELSANYLPWSGGARLCPGMKMAQVEFCSVFFALFQSYKVRPFLKQGETLEMATKRLRAVMADSQPRLSLQMNRPSDAELVWEARK